MDSTGAALLPKFGGYVIETATGEALALCEERESIPMWLTTAHEYFAEAEVCGHHAAPGWVAERFPLQHRPVTIAERESILEDGTPTLQREP